MFAALALGGEAGLLAGGLLFHAASVFDGVDGEIARATFRSSNAGAALDSAVDVGTNLLFVIGVTLNLGARSDLAFLLAGWGFTLFVLGLAAIAWRASRAAGPFSLDLVKHFYRRRFAGRLIPWLIEAMTIVSSRDFFALLFALLILAGLPMAVLYLFAAAATVWILFVLGSIRMPVEATLAPKQA
jgi:CDP-L-myo-inositol myo-inositolphosphotransferase